MKISTEVKKAIHNALQIFLKQYPTTQLDELKITRAKYRDKANHLVRHVIFPTTDADGSIQHVHFEVPFNVNDEDIAQDHSCTIRNIEGQTRAVYPQNKSESYATCNKKRNGIKVVVKRAIIGDLYDFEKEYDTIFYKTTHVDEFVLNEEYPAPAVLAYFFDHLYYTSIFARITRYNLQFLPDTGLPDTGLPDTGLPDTGLPDTGPRTEALYIHSSHTELKCSTKGRVKIKYVELMKDVGTSLKTDYSEICNTSLPFRERMAWDALYLLAKTQAKDIVHGDIKPGNICRKAPPVKMGDKKILHFIDVTQAHHVAEPSHNLYTPGYIAPELFYPDQIYTSERQFWMVKHNSDGARRTMRAIDKNKPHTLASDMFAMAITLSGFFKTQGRFQEHIHPVLLQLLNMMRDPEPGNRPDLAYMFGLNLDQNPFLSNYPLPPAILDEIRYHGNINRLLLTIKAKDNLTDFSAKITEPAIQKTLQAEWIEPGDIYARIYPEKSNSSLLPMTEETQTSIIADSSREHPQYPERPLHNLFREENPSRQPPQKTRGFLQCVYSLFSCVRPIHPSEVQLCQSTPKHPHPQYLDNQNNDFVSQPEASHSRLFHSLQESHTNSLVFSASISQT